MCALIEVVVQTSWPQGHMSFFLVSRQKNSSSRPHWSCFFLYRKWLGLRLWFSVPSLLRLWLPTDCLPWHPRTSLWSKYQSQLVEQGEPYWQHIPYAFGVLMWRVSPWSECMLLNEQLLTSVLVQPPWPRQDRHGLEDTFQPSGAFG